MVATILFDKFNTLLGQPSSYWQDPQTADEINPTMHIALSRGLPFYLFDSFATIVFLFLLVSILPRRIALILASSVVLTTFFAASFWLCYHWGFGVTGPLIYGLILSAILVLLVFQTPSKASSDKAYSRGTNADAINVPRLAPFLLGVVGTLLVADIALRAYQWRHNADARAFNTRFALTDIHTNNTSALAIVDRTTAKPLWIKWDLGPAGEPALTYLYNGRMLLNIFPEKGAPPRFDLTFYAPDGAVRAVWANRGSNAGFTERTEYGPGPPRKQIWFNDNWHTLVHRTNDGKIRGGIVLDGKWQHITFANGATVIDP